MWSPIPRPGTYRRRAFRGRTGEEADRRRSAYDSPCLPITPFPSADRFAGQPIRSTQDGQRVTLPTAPGLATGSGLLVIVCFSSGEHTRFSATTMPPVGYH